MEKSFKEIVTTLTSPLIVLAKNPFFEQVAAALALYLVLKKQNKDVGVVSQDPVTVEFNNLVGVDKITQELGNKNMVVRFKDYPAAEVERVTYDIENEQIKLIVIPKPGATPPKKEQLDVSYSGLSADGVFLVGGASKNHFEILDRPDFAGITVVHLGTRSLEGMDNGSYISMAKPMATTCEVVASFIKESGFEMDSDIASNLLMGIEDGTKAFSDPAMTADSYALVAELMRLGGRRKSKLETRKFPAGAIPGLPTEKPAGVKPASGDSAPKSWLEPKIYKGTSVS